MILPAATLGSYVAAAKARRREGLAQVFTLFPRLKERGGLLKPDPKNLEPLWAMVLD